MLYHYYTIYCYPHANFKITFTANPYCEYIILGLVYMTNMFILYLSGREAFNRLYISYIKLKCDWYLSDVFVRCRLDNNDYGLSEMYVTEYMAINLCSLQQIFLSILEMKASAPTFSLRISSSIICLILNMTI